MIERLEQSADLEELREAARDALLSALTCFGVYFQTDVPPDVEPEAASFLGMEAQAAMDAVTDFTGKLAEREGWLWMPCDDCGGGEWVEG